MNRSRPLHGRALFVLALLALGAAGCGFPGQPNPEDRPIPPDQVLAFKDLYGQNCAGCHGADGKMGPAPPLNDPLFRALVPEETVEDVVAGGRHGTLMPALAQENGGPLTPTQVAVLVNEIKGIPYRGYQRSRKGTKPGRGRPRSPRNGPDLGDARSSAARTRRCTCLPKDRRETQPPAGRVRPRLRRLPRRPRPGRPERRPPCPHDQRPAFLALISDQALRRIVITGRPDLGMPDYAHRGKDYPNYKPLTSEDVTNLVAFLSLLEGQAGRSRPSRATRAARRTMNEPHPNPERTPQPAAARLFPEASCAGRPTRRAPSPRRPWASPSSASCSARCGRIRRSGSPLGPVGRLPGPGAKPAWRRSRTRSGKPWDGKAAHTGVYVRYLGPDKPEKQQFVIFAMNCAHLGCPVSWFPQSGSVHVPLPRRRLLRQRRPRLGAAAARPVPVRLAGRATAGWRSRRRTTPRLQEHPASARTDHEALAEGRWGLVRRPAARAREPPADARRTPSRRGAAGPMGWWYVFGSASMTLLAHSDPHRHRPGAGVRARRRQRLRAACCTLNYEHAARLVPAALHYYAGSGMVVMVLVHMTQVFLHGAYKYPRELTWVVGVFLLLCVLGMFFSGQILRWDPDAYWGLAVGGSMAGRVPVVGPWVVDAAARRPHHRRRRPEPLLRPARVRHPRRAPALPGRPPLAGAQVRHQRAARPRPGRRSENLRCGISKRS